jgi:hypothetical protein
VAYCDYTRELLDSVYAAAYEAIPDWPDETIRLLQEIYMTNVTTVPPQAPEASGAARFTAVSYPNAPVKSVATSVELSLSTLDDRLSELEAVVHQIAPYSRNAEHGTVKSFVGKIKKRLTGGPG